MKKILLALFLSSCVAGCGDNPFWPTVTDKNPTPDKPTPSTDTVVDVAEIVKPSDDMGMEALLTPLFSSYKDQPNVKRDAGILAAMYYELADMIDRDGKNKRVQFDTTQDILDLQDSQVNFMIVGTDFGSIIRKYPNVVDAIKSLEQRTMGKEVGKIDDGANPSLRARIVNMFRAVAWGCHQAS